MSMELYNQLYYYDKNFPNENKEDLNKLASYIRQLDEENIKLLLSLIIYFNFTETKIINDFPYSTIQYGSGIMFNLNQFPRNLIILISRFLHLLSC